MKSKFKKQANFALIITVLSLFILSCDAWISVDGKISDETGKPVVGAKVVIEQGNSSVAEKTTGKDGSFYINERICPTPGCSSRINIKVNEEGFQPYEKTLSQEEMTGRRIIITLVKN